MKIISLRSGNMVPGLNGSRRAAFTSFGYANDATKQSATIKVYMLLMGTTPSTIIWPRSMLLPMRMEGLLQ